MRGRKNSIIKILTLCLGNLCFQTLTGQNLNTPNKVGPLGVEVNTLSGNIFISRPDAFAYSRDLNIDVEFYYNSFDYKHNIGFGNGWRMKYSIQYQTDSLDNKTIIWGDGREDDYIKNGTSFNAPTGIFSTLTQYQPDKYLLTKKEGMKYYFDNSTHKYITKIEDPNGNQLIFSYTDTLLTSISTSSGLSISLAYNSNGNLQSITDAITSPVRTTTYQYDGNGNLIQVTDPSGAKMKYSYLVNGPMKTMTDKNKNTVDLIYYNNITCSELIGCNKRVSFSYDTTLNETTCTDYLTSGNNQITKYRYKKNNGKAWVWKLTSNCCGFEMNFEYDQNGNKISESDANGNITTFSYDANGNPLSITDALGNSVHYTYSSDFNKVTSFTDEKGFTTNMTYDVKGNLTQITLPGNLTYNATYNANGDIISSTDPKGNLYNYNYDTQGNPVSVTGPNGFHVGMTYNARGDLITLTDPVGNKDSLEYDILSRIKKITDPLSHYVSFAYDSSGNLISTLNQNAQTNNIQYDASNRPVVITDAKGYKTTYGFDAMDNMSFMKDALGNVTNYEYDSRNRLSSVRDALGNLYTFGYDANGNMTSVNLPSGEVINYTYDVLNRIKTVNDNTGNLRTYEYDPAGNISSIADGKGGLVHYIFDNNNQVIQYIDQLGNTFGLGYDDNGNIISITDRNNHTRNLTYNNLDRLVTVSDNMGNLITATYDNAGNVTGLTDQNNHTTSYSYDSLYRLKRTTFPDGRFIDYTYDNLGNVLSKTTPDGSVINFVYDNLNRIISKTLPDGAVFSYTYDSVSRVLSATCNGNTVNFGYDALGRLISEVANGRTIHYNYNVSGRTQSMIYPDSTIVTYNFDVRNRLTAISKNNMPLVTCQYDANNYMTQKSFVNGVTTTKQYDAANRLIAYSTGTNGNIQNVTISYDNEGNVTEKNWLNDPSKSEQFTYDNNYRLIDYKKGPVGSPLVHNTYTYDALGNRVSANLNGTAVNYTVNNLNQITSITGPSPVNFVYDNNGNLTYDGNYFKTYDAEGRLVKDSSSPSNVITYAYDGLSRRVQQSLNGIPIHFSFAGPYKIEERDNGGSIINKNYFMGSILPLSNEKNGNSFYYHQNNLNSVEAITNSQGNVVEKYDYDVFGKTTIKDSLNNILNGPATGNRFGYTGQEFDTATGTIKFFFREYNPETGLFNQRDMIGYGDGMGMYQYVHNNPASGIDVFGLDGDPCDQVDYVKVAEQQESDVNGYGSIAQWVLDASRKRFLINWYENYIKGQKALFDFMKAEGNLADAVLVSNNHKLATETLTKLKAGKLPVSELSKGLSRLGMGLNVLDVAFKANNLYNATYAGNDPYGTQLGMAQANFIQSIVGFTPQGAIYNMLDFAQSKITKKSMNEHLADAGDYLGKNSFKDMSSEQEQEMEDWYRKQGKIETYMRIRREQFRREYLKSRKPDCPQNNTPHGTNQPPPPGNSGPTGSVHILQAPDPNAMIGPDGVPDKHWVSVHDRQPYTILFENSKDATAPAKYIRIVSPVEPKQDAASFQLGSFGFNNQTFTIPANTSGYYQRLDCRDSLDLYVDVTAGYDVVQNRFFWEFQSIDPVTLLPTANPLKGFLLQQDSSKGNRGHAFANFSTKPLQSAVTLDTISTIAKIVFDGNDTIPTNRHKNTIDAFAPTTHLNNLPPTSTNVINLSWTGADDVNGCGIKFYTLYVSTDGTNFNILKSGITRIDTTFYGANATMYYFFVLGTDSVGNTETLRPGEIKSTFLSSVLPVTWLYFKGKNLGKDNLLEWATANEQNTDKFILERSADGNSFAAIGSRNAAGNSSVTTYYDYTDRNVDRLRQDILYYRLKQTDINGGYKYSNIVRLRVNSKETINSVVYPNPTQGLITIAVGDNSLIGTEALLFDGSGRMLQRFKISANAQSIDLSRYVNGVYLIRLSNKEVLKIVKQ